jgi:hypothetical protein
MVRAPTYCNGDWATTVLAHLRMMGISAMAMKCPDWFGAWACSGCHDYVDGRIWTADSYETRRLIHLEGVVRTQHELLMLGHLPEAKYFNQETENT